MKMHKTREEWKNALFWVAPQVNSRMIEHLGYSPVEIITRIQLFTLVGYKIKIDLLPTQLKVPTDE